MKLIFILNVILVIVLPQINSESKEDLTTKLKELKWNLGQDTLTNVPIKPPSNKKIENRIETGTFVTKLDHFRPTDDRFVTFRYNSNTQFLNFYGPIYIHFKDFLNTSNSQLETGFIADQLPFVGGGIFTADYRFFGDNIPTDYIPDASFENLELLTIDQIIRDAAYLIDAIRSQNYYGNIIVWGSGFGGTVATFARQKLGHLIHAAWSSDGLIYFRPEAPVYYTYLLIDIVSTNYDCYDVIYEAMTRINSILRTGNSDEVQELERSFNLCEPIDTSSIQAITYIVDILAQAIADNIASLHQNGLDRMCRDLLVVPDPVESLVRWYNHMHYSQGCRDFSYEDFIEEVSDTRHNGTAVLTGERQMFYLFCTQFGLLRTSSPGGFIPDISLEYRLQTCEDIFGVPITYESLTRNTNHLDNVFGTDPSPATNIVFSNGYIHSWLYYQQSYTTGASNSYVEIFPHYGKSGDLITRATSHPESAFHVKERIEVHIRGWSDFFSNNANVTDLPGLKKATIGNLKIL